MNPPAGNNVIVEVRGLCTQFTTRAGTVKAVDDVSFSIAPGSIMIPGTGWDRERQADPQALRACCKFGQDAVGTGKPRRKRRGGSGILGDAGGSGAGAGNRLEIGRAHV